MKPFVSAVSSAAVAVLLSLAPSTASATVDSFLAYDVPYRHMQTDDVCFMPQVMWAEIGVPQGSMMRGAFAPTQTFAESPSPHYVNINLIATSPAMVPAYLSDSVDRYGRYLYTMSLDVTALAQANGSTVAGRQKTINQAKLALVTMANNMSQLAGGPSRYQLWVRFVGLPSQTGLTGKRLYSTTTYPYNGYSVLLQSYEAELINVGGTCP